VAAIPTDYDARGKAQGDCKSSRGKRERPELFPKSFARGGLTHVWGCGKLGILNRPEQEILIIIRYICKETLMTIHHAKNQL
jgi:hypothetical protein